MKTIKIKIFPDGHVQADVEGVKGKACTNYIRILEDILDAETVGSSYTTEYYEVEQQVEANIQQQKMQNLGCE